MLIPLCKKKFICRILKLLRKKTSEPIFHKLSSLNPPRMPKKGRKSISNPSFSVFNRLNPTPKLILPTLGKIVEKSE